MIVDQNGNEITTANLRIAPGGEKLFTLQLDAYSGYTVSAPAPPAGITIFAKGDISDSFQNIESAPLDLTPFAGSLKTIYFKITAGGAVELRNDLARIVVAPAAA